MLAFLIYTAKVAAALVVFYLFFRLLLSRETFHRLNRIILLCGVTASYLLPLCVITVNITVDSTRTTRKPNYLWIHSTGVDWWVVALFVLFLIGATVALVRLAIAFRRVYKTIREGERHPLPDGNVVVVLDTPEGREEPSPSSWMEYIFLSRKDFQNAEAAEFENSMVYIHEAAHLALRHSVDLLFLDFCALFQWFNPAIWLLRRELTALHEYEADKAVLDKGFRPRDYQLLLVQKAMSDAGYSVANNLNHSALKGRIDMMLRQPSQAWRALRLLVLVPLICAGLAMNAKRDYHSAPDRPFLLVGDNDNIFVRVDGKDFDKSKLDEIDPYSIQSIDVVKDGNGGGTIEIHLKK